MITYSPKFTNYTLSTTSDLQLLDTICYFANSSFGKNTVEDILWDIAKNCIARMGLEDAVIYLWDEENKTLVQKAAYGPKNPRGFEIYQPMVFKKGCGIVGSVAASGVAEIIPDTTLDDRYLVDDEFRFSEITVPIISNGKVIGVIDSEHHQKYFYNERHLGAMKAIANLCSTKINRAVAEMKLREKEKMVENLLHSSRKNNKLTIQNTDGIRVFPIEEIIRCEADSNYTLFYLTNQRYFCSSKTLKEYEEILGEHDFIRVHKSHVVNRQHIREFSFDGSMKMSDNSVVEVARRRKKEVEDFLTLN